MKLLTRRNALRTAGLAGFVPMIGVSRASPASFQSGETTSVIPPTFHPAVQSYMANSVLQVWSKHRAGSAHVEHFTEAASAVHAYAKHIDSLNIDLLAPYLASKIAPTSAEHVDKVHAAMSKYDPSYSRAEVAASVTDADEQTTAVQRSLLKHGISWHFYSAAQGLRLMAKLTAAEHANSASCNCGKAPRFQTSLFVPGAQYRTPMMRSATLFQQQSAVHIERVSFSSTCKKLLCQSLAGVLSGILTRTMIKAFTGAAADAFCDIDLVTSILADVASEGVTSIASPLEAYLCTAAQAIGASDYTADVVGTIVGGAITDLSSGMGCPSS